MSQCQSSENLNYENPFELKSNSFSQSIHSTLIDNRVNISNFFKKNPLKQKRKRQPNNILGIKINKILKSQKLINKKLECIANILMSKFANSNLYDLNHFEVNYIINKNEDDDNNYNSYNDSQNEEYDISQNKNKTEDLEVLKDDENENVNLKYKYQNPSDYNNKYSNFEINLNNYNIQDNKLIKKSNYEEEENEENINNEKEENKNENEFQNDKLYLANNNNNNEIKVEKIKEEISEFDNININSEKNKDNDNISISNYSEERNDVNRKISVSQQSNYSEKSNISKPSSSNMIKSSQDRFKKIREFNFKINITNKKSFQQNEKKEISKILNKPNDDIQSGLNNKENSKKNVETKKYFNVEQKEEKFDIITNDKIKDKKENE